MFTVDGVRGAGDPLIPHDAPIFDSAGVVVGAVLTGAFSFGYDQPVVMARVNGLAHASADEQQVRFFVLKTFHESTWLPRICS
jgi:hypothetical protein